MHSFVDTLQGNLIPNQIKYLQIITRNSHNRFHTIGEWIFWGNICYEIIEIETDNFSWCICYDIFIKNVALVLFIEGAVIFYPILTHFTLFWKYTLEKLGF